MALEPNQPPPLDDALSLAAYGFDPVVPSGVALCHRFRCEVPGHGLLYASHLPIPWGVYFDAGRPNQTNTCWCGNLALAIVVLFRLARTRPKQGGEIPSGGTPGIC